MVEYFAGKANVSKTFQADPAHRSASFELRDSRSMDFNSPAGFAFLAVYSYACSHELKTSRKLSLPPKDFICTISISLSFSPPSFQGLQSYLLYKAALEHCIWWHQYVHLGREYLVGRLGERQLMSLVIWMRSSLFQLTWWYPGGGLNYRLPIKFFVPSLSKSNNMFIIVQGGDPHASQHRGTCSISLWTTNGFFGCVPEPPPSLLALQPCCHSIFPAQTGISTLKKKVKRYI